MYEIKSGNDSVMTSSYGIAMGWLTHFEKQYGSAELYWDGKLIYKTK